MNPQECVIWYSHNMNMHNKKRWYSVRYVTHVCGRVQNDLSEQTSQNSSQRRHVSAMAFKITDNSTVSSTACSDQQPENIKGPHYWLFVSGIHRWPVDSPHKGPVMSWPNYTVFRLWRYLHGTLRYHYIPELPQQLWETPELRVLHHSGAWTGEQVFLSLNKYACVFHTSLCNNCPQVYHKWSYPSMSLSKLCN